MIVTELPHAAPDHVPGGVENQPTGKGMVVSIDN